MYFSDTVASDATGHCWTEQCTNGIQQLLPSCSVQITLGFMHVAAPIVFCPNLWEGRRQKIGGSSVLYCYLANFSKTLKKWCQHNSGRETAAQLRGSMTPQESLVKKWIKVCRYNFWRWRTQYFSFWFTKQVIACTVNFKALKMQKISTPS